MRPRQPTASQTEQLVELSLIKAIREVDSENFEVAEQALTRALELDASFVKARIWLHVCVRRS